MAEDVAAFGQHRTFPQQAIKTSDTQGSHDLFLAYYRFEYKAIITIWPLLHLGLYVIREFQIRVYREPLTAGGHVTSLSRHI